MGIGSNLPLHPIITAPAPPCQGGEIGEVKRGLEGLADKKITVLGLGNILLRDEGVGVHAIEELRKAYDFPENVEIIDGGTMGLDLLPFIEDADKLLIVDAVNLKKAPGTIAIIEDSDIPAFVSTKLSIHQIGLPDVIYALKLMDLTPPRMTLIGIQPESLETGLGMSGAINSNFGQLLNAIIGKLNAWGVEIKCKK
jgi:hydrogenase maturation protease